MALVLDVISTLGTFLTPWYTEKLNAYLIDKQLKMANKSLLSPIEKKQLAAIRIYENLAQKYPQLVQEIISTLCNWVRSQSPWNVPDINKPTPYPVVKAIKTITTLPRNDINGFPHYINLSMVTISGASEILRNTNFTNVFMPQCNVVNSVLSRSDFSYADLGGCRFINSGLEFTNFTNAKCCCSAFIEPIRPCSFENTEMYGAIFNHTNFEGATLKEAKQLKSEQLNDIIKNQYTVLPSFN